MLHDRLVSARLGAAGPPLRPAVRRHPASGARPDVPRRVRARPGRARRAAAAARGSAAARRRPRSGIDAVRSVAAGRSGRGRASAAEDRDRRGRRAALPVVSAARRRPKRARACRRSTRSTSCARSPAACPITACWRPRRPRRPARAWRGRRPPIPIARSTISSTTSPSLKPLLDSRDPASVKGHAHYLLGAERGAAALGHQPVGARPHRVVGERRPDRRHARTRGRRSQAHRLAAAPVFAVGAAAFRDAVRTSSCSRRSIGSSRGTSPSRSCAWIR